MVTRSRWSAPGAALALAGARSVGPSAALGRTVRIGTSPPGSVSAPERDGTRIETPLRPRSV